MNTAAAHVLAQTRTRLSGPHATEFACNEACGLSGSGSGDSVDYEYTVPGNYELCLGDGTIIDVECVGHGSDGADDSRLGGGYALTTGHAVVGCLQILVTQHGNNLLNTYVFDDTGFIAVGYGGGNYTLPGPGGIGDITYTGGAPGASFGFTPGGTGGGGGAGGPSGNGSNGEDGTAMAGGAGGASGHGAGGTGAYYDGVTLTPGTDGGYPGGAAGDALGLGDTPAAGGDGRVRIWIVG